MRLRLTAAHDIVDAGPCEYSWRCHAHALFAMFAGHVGVGLLLKRPGKTVSLGLLVLAALWLDIVLWTLVVVGVESMRVPENYSGFKDISYDFPYSHSLVASLAWSLAAFVLVRLGFRRTGKGQTVVACVIAAAVFSHFILDWLVHTPEPPVLGSSSPKLGLGLWRHLPLALAVEVAIAASGLWLYLRTVRLSRARALSAIALVAVVTVMTVVGETGRSRPKPMLLVSLMLVFVLLASAAAAWIDRHPKDAPGKDP